MAGGLASHPEGSSPLAAHVCARAWREARSSSSGSSILTSAATSRSLATEISPFGFAIACIICFRRARLSSCDRLASERRVYCALVGGGLPFELRPVNGRSALSAVDDREVVRRLVEADEGRAAAEDRAVEGRPVEVRALPGRLHAAGIAGLLGSLLSARSPPPPPKMVASLEEGVSGLAVGGLTCTGRGRVATSVATKISRGFSRDVVHGARPPHTMRTLF